MCPSRETGFAGGPVFGSPAITTIFTGRARVRDRDSPGLRGERRLLRISSSVLEQAYRNYWFGTFIQRRQPARRRGCRRQPIGKAKIRLCAGFAVAYVFAESGETVEAKSERVRSLVPDQHVSSYCLPKPGPFLCRSSALTENSDTLGDTLHIGFNLCT